MLHLSAEQIEAFVAVAREGSFSQAAKVLGKNRTTINQHISNLEIDLDIKVFERQGRTAVLTLAGKQLITPAKQVIYHLNYMQNCAESLARKEELQLTICHDGVLPASLLASVDKWIQDAFPLTEVNWLYRKREDIFNDLRDGRCDVGLALSLGRSLPADGIDFFNLGGLPFEVYAHHACELVELQPCSVNLFAQHRLVMLESYFKTPVATAAELSAKRLVVNNNEEMLAMLTSGGWAVVPSMVVDHSPLKQQLISLKVDYREVIAQTDYVIFSNKLKTAGPVLSEVVEAIKAQFQGYVNPNKW